MKKLSFIFIILVSTLLSAEWTIVQTYTIPGKASGLAWDGTYLYSGIYGTNGSDIYRIDPADGSYQLQFSDPVLEDTYGLTFDGENLWLTDHRNGAYEPAVAYEYDMNGNILSNFELPDTYMSGITYDNGNFWVATYYPDDPSVIYLMDEAGSILDQVNYDLPNNDDEQPWDICMEGGDLWIAEYNDDSLIKLDPEDGTILESHASDNIKPAGITFDGTYLWYVDGGLNTESTLYKVDLGGAGTPVIELGFDYYDFGEIIVGESESIDLPITNNGTADLSIIAVNFDQPQYTTVFQPPVVITPGQTVNQSIIFEPDAIGEFPAVMTIESDDPINPVMEVELAGYGILADPHIVIDPAEIDFGNIRLDATSGRFINISNQGAGILEISQFEFEIDDYFIDSSLELPLEISSNSSSDIRIWFNPQTAGNLDSYLIIHSNDPVTPMLDVTLEGNGEEMIMEIGSQIWQHQITTGYDNSPKAIAQISDVTDDGKNDVIITSEDNFVRCFNGNSSNTADIIWETEIYSGNIFGQNGLLIVADIDDDEYDDVVVGTGGGDRSIHCLSGRTGEIFYTYNTNVFGEGGTVYQVESALDFNNDGVNDVTAATGDDSYGTGPERIFLFDGSSGDLLWDFHTAGPKFSSLSVNDVNADGVPDVIGGASNNFETTGIVYGIDGADGDQLWEFETAGSSVWALETIDDANGDGIDDIVAGDFSGNIYALDPTDGSEIWTTSIGTCIILRFEILDDVNGNGYDDITVAHSSNSNVVVLDGLDGENIWLQPVADQPWVLDRIDDITGDNINDLIVGTLFNNNFAYFLDGTDGSELASIPIGSAVDAIGGLADVVGDATWEMVVGGRDGTIKCVSGGVEQVYSFEEDIPKPQNLISLQNSYPNPFNPSASGSRSGQNLVTNIDFILKEQAQVKLQIFNIKGEEVKTLADEFLPEGRYNFQWNGRDNDGKRVASGVYFYRVSTPGFSQTKKCLLLK